MQFAICLDNTGYEASLETGKLYQVVHDDEANKHGYIRLIDESGMTMLLLPTAFICFSFLLL